LARVGLDVTQIRSENGGEIDVLTDQAAEHGADVNDAGVEVEHAQIEHLLAAEGEELAGEGEAAVGGLDHLLEAVAPAGIGCVGQQQVAIALNYGEQVVEVVRDAAGPPPAASNFYA
jgi:hypothetical protein